MLIKAAHNERAEEEEEEEERGGSEGETEKKGVMIRGCHIPIKGTCSSDMQLISSSTELSLDFLLYSLTCDKITQTLKCTDLVAVSLSGL